MDLGLNIAASGMLAEQVRQDQLSNDLANASTPGYKADAVEQRDFGAMLLSNTTTGQTIGTVASNVAVGRSVTNLAPGSLQQTGQPLDFGIDGGGFFAVGTAQGVRYTRDGQFRSSAAGLLVDAHGNPVLGANRQPIPVSPRGTVPATALGVFNLTGAAKQGNNMFTGAVTGGATGVVRQGALENSAVNAVTTMVDMIASLRAYETGQKAIQSIDETMQSNATSVGSVPA